MILLTQIRPFSCKNMNDTGTESATIMHQNSRAILLCAISVRWACVHTSWLRASCGLDPTGGGQCPGLWVGKADQIVLWYCSRLVIDMKTINPHTLCLCKVPLKSMEALPG